MSSKILRVVNYDLKGAIAVTKSRGTSAGEEIRLYFFVGCQFPHPPQMLKFAIIRRLGDTIAWLK